MVNDKTPVQTPQDESVDDETKAVSVPDAGDSGEGKLKMIVSLVKKCLGVKDIASMCVLSGSGSERCRLTHS